MIPERNKNGSRNANKNPNKDGNNAARRGLVEENFAGGRRDQAFSKREGRQAGARPATPGEASSPGRVCGGDQAAW
jgi:hypothetical protein